MSLTVTGSVGEVPSGFGNAACLDAVGSLFVLSAVFVAPLAGGAAGCGGGGESAESGTVSARGLSHDVQLCATRDYQNPLGTRLRVHW